MPRKKPVYPRPGTMAETVLEYIREHPGCSSNAIIRGLELNPSPARACMSALLSRGLIEDNKNEQGHHAYSATEVRTRA